MMEAGYKNILVSTGTVYTVLKKLRDLILEEEEWDRFLITEEAIHSLRAQGISGHALIAMISLVEREVSMQKLLGMMASDMIMHIISRTGINTYGGNMYM